MWGQSARYADELRRPTSAANLNVLCPTFLHRDMDGKSSIDEGAPSRRVFKSVLSSGVAVGVMIAWGGEASCCPARADRVRR